MRELLGLLPPAVFARSMSESRLGHTRGSWEACVTEVSIADHLNVHISANQWQFSCYWNQLIGNTGIDVSSIHTIVEVVRSFQLLPIVPQWD